MFIPGIILILSLIVLIKSSESVIHYSIRISNLTGICQLVIGFVLVAFATALPDISIAVLSSFSNNGILSLGNVLGSHILKICLIVGLIAVFVSIKTTKEESKDLIKTLSITSTIPIILIIFGSANFIFGIICLVAFGLFFISLYIEGYKPKKHNLRFKGLKTIELIKALFFFALSMLIVIISAKFLIDSAIE
ncbi:MAG: hypothetical protein PHU12_04680, partial [Candidatus Aenigmarchaeota archaeon]|nr:hypothetical protein [Candidatus Aenigmarchaeota archaeon]